MSSPILFLPILLAFFTTLIILPKWIKKAKKIGLVWPDMNKKRSEEIAGSGGIIVVLGFILAVLFYISIITFYFHYNTNVIEIFSLTTSILILAVIGFTDDLLGWQHKGLGIKFRLFLCLFASIPLIVINAGHSSISLPLIDGINLGLIYPLLIIPVGIVGASVSFNILAGYNGLESGQGILILAALSIVTFFTGSSWLSLICLCMIASLAAFWVFNKYPAKVFPGDVLTYSVGGLIAVIAILGNIERIAIFFFIPYIIEVILKSRGRLIKHSFGKPNKDLSLNMPYNKIYGLEHFSIWFLKKIKKKVYENDVVYFIYLIQIVVILIGLIIFKNSIF